MRESSVKAPGKRAAGKKAASTAKPEPAPKAKGGSRTVSVGALARVEGEGGLFVKIKGDKVVASRFDVYEPPRFFEAFLRGRRFTEAPDITARICGICPVAYQMSSVHAMESACGVTVSGALRELRRLLYCGEWIESRPARRDAPRPDFLGYESAIHMAKDHPELVTKSLALKKVGNEIVTLVGGREIHPINVRVGGFYKAPAKADVVALGEKLRSVRPIAAELLSVAGSLTFPDFAPDYEFVSLRHPDEYPLCEGRIVSSRGLDIAVSDYENHFVEEHVEHANALHSRKKSGGIYLVGPAARYANNFDRFPRQIQEAAKAAGLGPVERNPFKSIVIRSVETLWAIDEALRIIDAYEPPPASFVEVPPRAASGAAISEAPRGILYHRYRIGADGLIQEAKIVPPTSQNQKQVEDDLRAFVEARFDMPLDTLTWQCEQAVRNYDPCISCATHAVRVRIERD
ncbi:MAG: nickel-dependent hydrogenase large subunit [Holophagales bacterium]|nr:nickel-dependent hydrogenase large subunit [Holophagales bacterium]